MVFNGNANVFAVCVVHFQKNVYPYLNIPGFGHLLVVSLCSWITGFGEVV